MEGEAYRVKLSNVTIATKQADLQSAVNERLPTGYAIEQLHITQKGLFATCVTPKFHADIHLDIVQGDVQDTENFDAGKKLRVHVHANKWIPIPGLVIHQVLMHLVGDGIRGVTVEGSCLVVDWSLLLPECSAVDEIVVRLSDGALSVQATGVVIPISLLTTRGFTDEAAVTQDMQGADAPDSV